MNIENKIKVIELAKELGFDERPARKHSYGFTKNDGTRYDIFIGDTKGNIFKTINLKATCICNTTSDFNILYKIISEEFKYEIRNIKINKLLN